MRWGSEYRLVSKKINVDFTDLFDFMVIYIIDTYPLFAETITERHDREGITLVSCSVGPVKI